jgi:choline dehydrogenase-like flavoprotein
VSFNGSVKRAALLPADWPGGRHVHGPLASGIVTYDFLESHGVVLTAAKALPIQAVTARLRLPGESARARRMGAAHVEMMRLFRRGASWSWPRSGLTPATASISVNASGKPRVGLTPSDALRAYESRTRALLDSLFTRAGFTPLEAEWLDGEGGVLEGLHFSTAHQLGSCRMADDPAHGVVDADGEVFHYPGLFVCDGAAIPGALAVNPSLTIAANAERIAERVLRRYRGASLLTGDPR